MKMDEFLDKEVPQLQLEFYKILEQYQNGAVTEYKNKDIVEQIKNIRQKVFQNEKEKNK